MELVRCIHLNPLRVRVVNDIAELDAYRFAGQSYLMGKQENEWRAFNRVLSMFGDRISLARRRYRGYVKRGIDQGRRPALTGGGLIRSSGGWAAVRSMRKAGISYKSDERILGGSDFVRKILAEANETMGKKYTLAAKGIGFDDVVAVVSRLLSVKSEALKGCGKERIVVKGRSLVCYWSVAEQGFSMTDVAQRLGIAVSAVSVAVKKGRQIVGEAKFELAYLLNIEI